MSTCLTDKGIFVTPFKYINCCAYFVVQANRTYTNTKISLLLFGRGGCFLHAHSDNVIMYLPVYGYFSWNLGLWLEGCLFDSESWQVISKMALS